MDNRDNKDNMVGAEPINKIIKMEIRRSPVLAGRKLQIDQTEHLPFVYTLKTPLSLANNIICLKKPGGEESFLWIIKKNRFKLLMLYLHLIIRFKHKNKSFYL